MSASHKWYTEMEDSPQASGVFPETLLWQNEAVLEVQIRCSVLPARRGSYLSDVLRGKQSLKHSDILLTTGIQRNGCA